MTSHNFSVIRILIFILTIVSSVVMISCSSTKNTKATRGFHTFVSYFNGLYNAKVLYKEATVKADKTVKVPEEGFMPIITVGGVGGGSFDKIIEKCDVLIFRHKIGNCTDDAYLLKGKCEYFKGKYFEANIAFEYVLNEFPKTDLKTEANYWLAKTNYVTNNRYRALEYLDAVKKKPSFKGKKAPKPGKDDPTLLTQVAALEVTMLIEKKEYEKATEVLVKNLPLVKKKYERVKWEFLLAQLYEQQKDVDMAKRYYNSVIALNVNNDLNFRAKLNIVQLYIDNTARNTSSDLDEITAPLRKMLTDNKYKEFRDQLYYKLAQMEQKRNDLPLSLSYYRSALASAGNRPVMKTNSYFQIGQIYFYKKQMLDSAQAYYDSAAATVDDKNKEVYAIRTMSKMLKRYKVCKFTVREQDSLLQIANLGEEEQKKRVADYVEKEEKWKEQAKQKKESDAQRLRGQMMQEQFQQEQGTNLVGMGANVFYFDNPTQVSQGRGMFVRQWGDRKNEDDWRRKVKSKSFGKMAFDEETENVVSDDRNDPVNGVEARKKKYLARIPKTQEDKDRASEKILSSLFELAQLFSQKFNMPDSAIKYYNILVRKFPNSDYVPKSYYAIYTMYEAKKNPRSGEYKQLILDKYPNSQYAKLLRKEKLEDSDETAKDFNAAYKSLLGLYTAGDYETALSFSQVVIDNHLTHPELSKVWYIKGASLGSMGNTDSMKSVYTSLRKSYPDDEVTKVALKTLQLLEAKQKGADLTKSFNKSPVSPEIKTDSENDISAEALNEINDPNEAFKGFVPNNNKDPYNVVMLIDEKRIPRNKLEILIADFNSQNYKANNLQYRVLSYLDNRKKIKHLVSVSSFDNAQVANAYLEQLTSGLEIATLLAAPQTDAFFVSATNFREAFSNKRFHHYSLYFLTQKEEMLKN